MIYQYNAYAIKKGKERECEKGFYAPLWTIPYFHKKLLFIIMNDEVELFLHFFFLFFIFSYILLMNWDKMTFGLWQIECMCLLKLTLGSGLPRWSSCVLCWPRRKNTLRFFLFIRLNIDFIMYSTNIDFNGGRYWKEKNAMKW